MNEKVDRGVCVNCQQPIERRTLIDVPPTWHRHWSNPGRWEHSDRDDEEPERCNLFAEPVGGG